MMSTLQSRERKTQASAEGSSKSAASLLAGRRQKEATNYVPESASLDNSHLGVSSFLNIQ